ncbi:NB-ARC domain-containing protein [Kitasatospora sp. NPDC057904]|uniref:NB-ARC domain-containing protein n=1 Tax=unclassified Kitasatospora TaxID=2633591 RepID=UPI0036DC476B
MLREWEPGEVRTMDDFVAELRKLKARAGNPSITQITRRVHLAWQRAGRPCGEWPARSTVGNCFRFGRRRPNADLLLAVVHALVDGDAAAVSAWRQALRTVLGEAEAAGRVAAAGRLPDLPAGHVVREGLVERASHVLDDGALVLEGQAGIGKTSLAVDLARRTRTARPVLFADLRGSAVGGAPPADPRAVLESFLRILGVAGERIPHGLDARVRLYRQLLGASAPLVVLDDAADADQVRPLLPAGPTGTTLVTSRTRRAELDGVRRMSVPALEPKEALAVLRATAGSSRIEEDEQTAGRMAELLGHHPLALSVIGRHLREHPDWELADYSPEPLTALALEGGVRAALAATDAKLPGESRRLLRLLALHPRRPFTARTAAVLAGRPDTETRALLTALVRSHLVEESAAGYHLPNLVHAYARERIGIDEPASCVRRAVERVFVHHYSTVAVAV